MTLVYRCEACGARWVAYPAGEAIEKAGRCLRCDGTMVPDSSPAGDTGDPVEDDAEA